MTFLKSMTVVGAVLLTASTGWAATIGVAVDSSGVAVGAASTISDGGGERADLVAFSGIGAESDVVGFFVPLEGGGCVFGEAGCGTSSDSGTGISILTDPMTMYLKFSGLSAGHATMQIWFEDLDVEGFHDNWWFREFITVHDAGGTEITPLGMSGDSATQQTMTLDLGLIGPGDYTASLKFGSWSHYYAHNTAEFLIAAVDVTPVPLPAAGFGMLFGIGALVSMRRRKKS